MKKLIVASFRKTIYGFQLWDSKNNSIFVSNKAIPEIETGMEITYSEHAKGDPYPESFGVEGEFQSPGVHDTRISKGIKKALLDYRAELADALS